MELTLVQAIKGIKPSSEVWRQKAIRHLNNLAIPRGSLGQLLCLAEQLASIKQTLTPSVSRKTVVTMAGDHGVVAEGVSAFPQEVTVQMVGNFVAGGAAINVLAEVAGAQVLVVDMGIAADMNDLVKDGRILSRKVDYGTQNMSRGPAMTRDQAIQGLEAGINLAGDLVREGVEILATGDMGIGNTTPSSAILAVFSGLSVQDVTGRGTGINDAALKNKVRVIQQALDVNKPDAKDPVDVLAKVGGFEIAGIAGLILGAAYYKVPVVVDGFISTAGALLAKQLVPCSLDYMMASHQSMEYGHRFMLKELGLKPILNLDLRLGEGTGAALAMTVVEAAARVIAKVMTFEDAGVSRDASAVNE